MVPSISMKNGPFDLMEPVSFSVELQVESLNGMVLPVIIAGSMEQIVMLVLLGPLMW